MDTLNLQIAKQAFQKVILNPTLDNKFMFIYEHKPYIETIMRKHISQDYFEYEDVSSDIMNQLYKKAQYIKFELGYAKCKNLLCTMTINHIKNIYIAGFSGRRIPRELMLSPHSLRLRHDKKITIDDLADKDYYAEKISKNVLAKVEYVKEKAEGDIKVIIDLVLDGYKLDNISNTMGSEHKYYAGKKLRKFGDKLKRKSLIEI